MLIKNKRKLSIVETTLIAMTMLIASPNTALADEINQSNQSSQQNQVTTQSLYCRCIDQDTGRVLQTVYADTVKVVNGVPERKYFHLGQLPENIGKYVIAKTPAQTLIVDSNVQSGITYINCDYHLPTAQKESTKTENDADQPNQTKQRNIVNDALSTYRAYHHTDKGFVAPGYYDKNGNYHPKMSTQKWREKNNIPNSITPGKTSKRQIASTSSKAKKSTPKKNKPHKAIKQNSEAVQRRNANILKFVVIPLVIIVAIVFFIPKKFWRKFSKNKGKHAK